MRNIPIRAFQKQYKLHVHVYEYKRIWTNSVKQNHRLANETIISTRYENIDDENEGEKKRNKINRNY